MKPPVDGLVQASTFLLCSLVGATTALGQITPDNTLGNESSVVTPNVDVNGALADLIEGGAIRNSNLFHSFSDFNVAEFGRVYFANPAGVANILSRVTGANVSNILGTLGVLGNANLFVINPNGIVFGPNSRLDVGGSFFGSTADSVLFEDGTVFSAKNPNEKPLLTINIPSGLQYGSNPGSITNQSRREFGERINGFSRPEFVARINGLQVPDGQTLGLIGGEVNIPGGHLTATDGRIELGSVGTNGVVNLTPTDTSFGLDYSAVEQFQDISLSEGAVVDTSGEGGGSIQIQGANVSLRDLSFVFADTLGSLNGGGIVVEASQLSLEGGSQITTNVWGFGQGGDLTVDASSSVELIGTDADSIFASGLFAATFGKGNAGDVTITTGELIVKDGARVSATTLIDGDGGNLTVDASSTVQLIGTSADGQIRSGLFTQTLQIGNGGDVSITTGQLIVSDGAVVLAITVGEGDGGNLTVDANSKVQVIGTSADGQFPSGLLAQTSYTGKGGDISITTGEFIVSDGAQVLASPIDEGDGGNLTVDADSSVEVIGTSFNGQFPSALSTQTQGTGKAGNLKITTGELMVSDGGQVAAGTFGEGEGGELIVDADSTVQVIGTSADGRIVSGLFTQTEGTGKARDVKITTRELIVSDGAALSASTFGLGDGGNLTVDASSKVQVMGISASGGFVSGLSTQANREATGNAGDVSITTGQLMVSDRAVVSASTFGIGGGGNLSFNTSSTVQAIDPFTSAVARFHRGITPDAGTLFEITTGQLIVEDGAEVSARSIQQGNSAGDVDIKANSIFLDNKGIISAETAGEQGNIRLQARDIRLLNQSKITTNAQNTTGGNITIDTDTLVGLGNSNITANALEGEGGRVEINAKGIFGKEFQDRLTPGNDITATSTLGPSFSGQVILNTPDLDPTSGLTELPGSPVDAEAILANDLCAFENNRIAGGSSFIITGKGGLPPTPEDPVINAHRTVRWRTRPGLASNRQRLAQQAKPFGHATGTVRRSQDKKVIIEAQGWVTAKDGTIILTAQPFQGTPVEQIFPNLDCHSGRGSRE